MSTLPTYSMFIGGEVGAECEWQDLHRCQSSDG
jgi:hypothetical protein